MPRLVKGAKWVFGWVTVGPDRRIAIPPDAWREYGFRAGEEAIFVPASRRSGGFGLSTPDLMARMVQKTDGVGPDPLARGRFGDGCVVLPAEIEVRPGQRLLAARGSGLALGFVAQGLVYEEALGHPELVVW